MQRREVESQTQEGVHQTVPPSGAALQSTELGASAVVDRADEETASLVESLPARAVVLALETKFVAMTGKVATKCRCAKYQDRVPEWAKICLRALPLSVAEEVTRKQNKTTRENSSSTEGLRKRAGNRESKQEK